MPSMHSHRMTTSIDEATRATSAAEVRMMVGTDWVGPDERETIEVIDPSTGQRIADVPVATTGDAQAALETAQRAQPGWAGLTPGERATYLRRIGELVRADADRLARL